MSLTSDVWQGAMSQKCYSPCEILSIAKLGKPAITDLNSTSGDIHHRKTPVLICNWTFILSYINEIDTVHSYPLPIWFEMWDWPAWPHNGRRYSCCAGVAAQTTPAQTVSSRVNIYSQPPRPWRQALPHHSCVVVRPTVAPGVKPWSNPTANYSNQCTVHLKCCYDEIRKQNGPVDAILSYEDIHQCK